MHDTPVPFFNPARFDRTEDKHSQEVESLEMGLNWTRQAVSDQAFFAREYAEDKSYEAAWLLGLAAVAADNQTTSPLLAQALDAGLSVQDAARLGIRFNSFHAAQALAERGVDFPSLRIIKDQEPYANGRNPSNMANEALIEHHLAKAGHAARRHGGTFNTYPVLDQAFSARAWKFLEGVGSEVLDPSVRQDTRALGLADRQAFVASIAVAYQAWPLAEKFLRQPLSQAVLDEMLLAAAMAYPSVDEHRFKGSRKQLTNLVSRLLGKGAKPDARFSFGMPAIEALGDGERVPPQKRYMPGGEFPATTRDWALHSASQEMMPQALQDMFMPSPWPPRKKDPWHEVAFRRYSPRGSRGGEPLANILPRVLDNSAPPPETLPDLLHAALACGEAEHWDAFDCVVSHPVIESLRGNLTRSQMIELVKTPVELHRNHRPADQSLADNWWKHKRLKKLAELMAPEDQKDWHETFSGFLRELPADILPGKTYSTAQMAFESSLLAFQAGATQPYRPRRTL